MLPTSTAWPWSSQECGISDINACIRILILVLAYAMAPFALSASAATIQSGADVQASIASASPGDIILVGPGEYSSFQVDKTLAIQGVGMPKLRAAIQRPAITIDADGVTISGFKIDGVGKDTQSKFNYYMNNPAAAAGLELDLPNAAVIVKGNDVRIVDSIIFGAQVGIYADGVSDLALQNDTLESCDQGAELLSCFEGSIKNCSIISCGKSGLDAEQCSQMVFSNNSIMNATHAGLMLKESSNCSVYDNRFSGNREGLAVWNSSYNDIRRNRADHSYYGIFLAGSHNNTVIDNQADENSNPKVVGGFGMGISLLENSSHNIIARNSARKDFNGIELTRGCKFNAVYANNLSDNKHGIRLDKNYNNLVYGNNFIRNTISGYDNASRNIWNTTFGNYYSDYRGKDENGDGIGDQPYLIPKGDQDEMDALPLMRPYYADNLDFDPIRADVIKYARFGPMKDEIPVYRMEGRTAVISSQIPTSPPKWPDSKSIFD